MATKLICDRCGEEISKKDTRHSLEVDEFSPQTKMEKDLCQTCYFLLRKWLAERK